MEKGSKEKKEDSVEQKAYTTSASEPQSIYAALKEKTYSHEEVFGNLRKRLKTYYGEE